MTLYLLLIAAILLPMFVVGLGLFLARWRAGEYRRKSPVSRKVCRYPGYTLTQEVRILEEKMGENLLMLSAMPAALFAMASIPIAGSSEAVRLTVSVILYIAVTAFFGTRLFRDAHQFRRKRLGLVGEQLVGNQLSILYRFCIETVSMCSTISQSTTGTLIMSSLDLPACLRSKPSIAGK